jgi:hypothetical protein
MVPEKVKKSVPPPFDPTVKPIDALDKIFFHQLQR